MTYTEDISLDFGAGTRVPIPVLATHCVTTNYLILVHLSFCIYKMGIITVPAPHKVFVKMKCLELIKHFINTRHYY